MAKSNTPPEVSTPNYPPMEPVAFPSSPFVARVYSVTCKWVQEEWLIIDAIKRDRSRSAKATQIAIQESRLTLDNLAKRLDNISQATLQRELKRLNAPTPGEIIRLTRLHFARHLLLNTRMLIREIALRAGYENRTHFTIKFNAEFGCSPARLRRRQIPDTSPCKTPPKSKT